MTRGPSGKPRPSPAPALPGADKPAALPAQGLGGAPAQRSSFPARLGSAGGGAGVGPGGGQGGAPGMAAPAPGGKLLRPQRPLEQAAADQARQTVPAGLGLDSARVRAAMAQRLAQQGLRDTRVLAALAAVPRHLFVDSALAIQAYEDTSLPIGLGQTISKPSVVARMIELLCTRPGADAQAARPLGKVLEIGSGCGYQAAVLAQLSRDVVSIERLRGLHDKARVNLREARVYGVRLVAGDGMLGHPGAAPFDCIIAAAGGSQLPPAWVDQLAPGGRLVAPVQSPGGASQMLTVVDRLADGSLVTATHEPVHFVPLKSGLS